MTFTEFQEYWSTEGLSNKKSHIRDGQSLMIYLFEVWPKEYNRIVTDSSIDPDSVVDCFYNDKLIPVTLSYLKDRWKDFPF